MSKLKAFWAKNRAPRPVPRPAAADIEPLPREQAIAFTDEFEKAKRNVLFWAVATIALVFGASSPDGVELQTIAKGVHFAPGLTVLGSLAILSFMMAGFIRATDRMLRFQSEFYVTEPFASPLAAAKSLQSKIDAGVAAIDDIVTEQARVAEMAATVLPAIESCKAAARRVVEGKDAQVTFSVTVGPEAVVLQDPVPPDTINRMFKNAVDQAGAQFTGALLSLEGQIDAALKSMTGAVNADETTALDKLKLELVRLNSIPRSLMGFSDRLTKNDRNWFWSFDMVPVAAAFLLSWILVGKQFHDHTFAARTSARLISLVHIDQPAGAPNGSASSHSSGSAPSSAGPSSPPHSPALT